MTIASISLWPTMRASAGETITVAAAISLREAAEELGKSYETKAGDHVEFVFGSSGQLMAQLKAGAPTDLFISAGQSQIDELQKTNLILAASRQVVAMNRLVLIIPKSQDAAVWKGGFATLSSGSIGRLAIGDPKSVPAGQYAMQVLERLKLVDATASKLVYGTNVRQVLSYVERGEVAAGIVYATDAAAAGDQVQVVATADASTHDPIEYPAVLMAASKHADAANRFMSFLMTDEGRATLSRKGFIVDHEPATAPSSVGQ